MTPSGPLGRDSMALLDKMVKYKAAMEFNLYAAEQACTGMGSACIGCPFQQVTGDSKTTWCYLYELRVIFGNHIEQHDIPQVPPCQCAGDCGKGEVKE